MRVRAKNSEISVHAVAGTHVVLLGLDAKKGALDGLLGFAIHRSGGGRPYWLRGGRLFKGQPKGTKTKRPDSRTAPIQTFLWSDYAAAPGKQYTYTVYPVYGTPKRPKRGEGLEVTVTTEQPDDGVHGIHFNRAVAGSQEVLDARAARRLRAHELGRHSSSLRASAMMWVAPRCT